MRRSVSVFFVAVLLFSLSSLAMDGCSRGGMQSAEVHRISKEDLKALLGDPNTTIIDVRQEGDWRQSNRKIKGAVREDPMQGIGAWEGQYRKDKRIVLYCA